MINSLNFKHIFYFWMVARESSIRKASDILNVSPSSISEQIKTLEFRIGVHLFDRGQKKMSLTSQGKVLYATLNEFFPRVEELFEGLANHKSTDVKFLRVGLTPALSTDLRYKLCFPFIEDIHYTVKILQGENQFLTEAFNQDDIDILFTTNSNLSPRGKYERFKIANKEFVITTNKNVYDRLPAKNKVKALGKEKYINYTPDSDLHFKVFNYLHQQQISPIRIAEIDDIRLVKNTMQQLDCFSFLPMNSVKNDIKQGRLFQVGRPIKMLTSQITAIYKPQFHSTRFKEHLDQLAKNLKLSL